MLRAMNYSFVERLIAYDAGQPEGKYLYRDEGEDIQMRAIFKRLLADGVIDRVDEVPWGDSTQQNVLEKYFHRVDGGFKDFWGSPIYQYLYALERCTGEYLLHVDSDMLFHCNPAHSWIDESIEMMRQNPNVVIATPSGGPPQANNWLERVRGRPAKSKPKPRWFRAATMSTRYFLLDKKRFEQHVIPLVQQKSAEPLEDSITHTLNLKGFHRWTMSGRDNWAIHPLTHDDNFVRNLSDLIWAVENAVYPFKRKGDRWDMLTEGVNINTWLRAIRRARGQ